MNTLTTKDYLTYYDGKNELPENAFRISASSFNTFLIPLYHVLGNTTKRKY